MQMNEGITNDKVHFRVLIVEDSFIVASHLRLALTQAGYEVVGPVDSAEEALALCSSTRPDLVFMDITLNGEMDGIECAMQLQKTDYVPVVFVTALSDRDTISRASVVSPIGYLTKPFDDTDVYKIANQAMASMVSGRQ